MNQLFRSAAILLVLAVAPSLFGANPPALLSIDPLTVIAGTNDFVLTANGAGFLQGAVIFFNDAPRPATFVSSTQVTAPILASEILTPGNATVAAANPGTVASSSLTLTILPNSPTISGLTPNSVSAGTSSLNITINGQNFASTAVARVGNSASANRTTAYVDSSHLTMTLQAADVALPASLAITVLNPNNHVSNTATLTVTAATPPPTITLLNPNNVTAGGTAFSLSVVGTNFVSGSSVRVNGTPRITTFTDSAHLTAQITAPDIATPGTLSVTVVNPDGKTSSAATLTVSTTLSPVINSISPSTVPVGAAPFTLTIDGANFVVGSTVQLGTSSRASTFVNSARLTVGVATSDVVTAGQVPVTVTTPQPHPATSNQVILFVLATNAPSITSINPQAVQAGTGTFGVLVNGTNFLFDDIVQVNGSARTTQFISATQMAASIPASDIASAGILAITVARHDGSATSAPVMLTVADSASPSITAFNPTTANIGDPSFTLVIVGHNFDSTSVVLFDNTPRGTQFVSATELHITVTAADLTTARSVPVQVVNGGGATSPVALFPVTLPVPVIASVTPSSVISGDAGFLLIATGTNFSPDSVININGTPRATQMQASTGALTTNIDAAEISAPGTLVVTVTRNGGTSAPVNLPVLAPTITAVNPPVIVSGSSGVTLNVQGSAFLSTSKIVFKGTERTTTFNADGSLTTTLSGTDLGDPGQYAVSVKNSPNSLSAPFLIEVQATGTPHIDAIQPSSIAAGSGITSLQLTGTNFVALSIVRVNGDNRATTFVAGNLLNATLLPQDIASPGTLHVTVRNPDGKTSSEALVTVTGTEQTPSRRRVAAH